MTEIVNLFCIICTEEFQESDEIVSTYCGHILHSSCFQDWQTRSPTCPECRAENPQTHRVYLHLENPRDRQIPVQAQVEFENKISKLEHELEISEVNFLQCEESNCKKDREIADLKAEIDCEKAQNESFEEELDKLRSQLEESEKNFMNLFEEINKKDQELRENETEINFLKLKNQNREKHFLKLKAQHEQTELDMIQSLQKISVMNEELKEKEEGIQKLELDMGHLKIECHKKDDDEMLQKQDITNVRLVERIRVLEERLRQISIELEREIGNSTSLTVRNMKLTKLINMSSEEDIENIALQINPASEKA